MVGVGLFSMLAMRLENWRGAGSRILVVSPQTTVLQECDGQAEGRRAEFGACDFGAWLGAVQHGRKERKDNCHPQAEGLRTCT